MRRREKFVILSVLLSVVLFLVQSAPFDIRWLALLCLTLLSYIGTALVLRVDLNKHELITVVPMPAMYALATGWFYFLLPGHLISRVILLILFGVGMYALLLTGNIYAVAKAKTIQLLYAAHAIGQLFTLLTVFLFASTIFSLRWPFYITTAVFGLILLPLVLMSMWSVRLQPRLERNEVILSLIIVLVMIELTIALCFLPLPGWYSALFLMSTLYIGVGVGHNALRGRLFHRTLREYSLLAVMLIGLFIWVFPGK